MTCGGAWPHGLPELTLCSILQTVFGKYTYLHPHPFTYYTSVIVVSACSTVATKHSTFHNLCCCVKKARIKHSITCLLANFQNSLEYFHTVSVPTRDWTSQSMRQRTNRNREYIIFFNFHRFFIWCDSFCIVFIYLFWHFTWRLKNDAQKVLFSGCLTAVPVVQVVSGDIEICFSLQSKAAV